MGRPRQPAGIDLPGVDIGPELLHGTSDLYARLEKNLRAGRFFGLRREMPFQLHWALNVCSEQLTPTGVIGRQPSGPALSADLEVLQHSTTQDWAVRQTTGIFRD